jgi:hypothetical protein
VGNLSPEPTGLEHGEGQVTDIHNEEEVTVVPLRAAQLGHVILNVDEIKCCAQRTIELTERLIRAAPRLGWLIIACRMRCPSVAGTSGWPRICTDDARTSH